jgi:hypothetical protein
MYCITRFYYSRKFLFRYITYVLIDCLFSADHISLYKFDLSYICVIVTNYYDMYVIIETHAVLYLLLSNNKFCIHSGGSLEY